MKYVKGIVLIDALFALSIMLILVLGVTSFIQYYTAVEGYMIHEKE